jgi:hypothetical protein
MKKLLMPNVLIFHQYVKDKMESLSRHILLITLNIKKSFMKHKIMDLV